MFQTAPTGRTPLGSDPNNYPQPVLRDHSNKTAMKRCKTAPPDEYGNSSAARSALINNPRYNPSRNGVQTKKNDPSERTERVIFVFAAVFLRPAGGFVKRLEQFRETPLLTVSPTGIEPATFGTGNRCSNPLSYGDIAGRIPNDVILAHGVVGD